MSLWGSKRKRRSFRSRRAHDRFRRRRMVRTTLFLFLIVVLLFGTWYGARREEVSITSISISGTEVVSPQVIRQKAEWALSGTYLFLVPHRFSYTYPRERIIEAVTAIPRIKSVRVMRTSRTEISISVTERKAAALWCREMHEDGVGDCQFVSGDGHAFLAAPPLSGSVLLRYMTENREPETGTALTTSYSMKLVTEFVRVLAREHGMYVYVVVETADGDIHYRIRGGGEILIERGASLQAVFENLDSILSSEAFRHIAPGNFEYIDLRFGNRVYVKEGSEEAELFDGSLSDGG